jgi:hypothetical protein
MLENTSCVTRPDATPVLNVVEIENHSGKKAQKRVGVSIANGLESVDFVINDAATEKEWCPAFKKARSREKENNDWVDGTAGCSGKYFGDGDGGVSCGCKGSTANSSVTSIGVVANASEPSTDPDNQVLGPSLLSTRASKPSNPSTRRHKQRKTSMCTWYGSRNGRKRANAAKATSGVNKNSYRSRMLKDPSLALSPVIAGGANKTRPNRSTAQVEASCTSDGRRINADRSRGAVRAHKVIISLSAPCW